MSQEGLPVGQYLGASGLMAVLRRALYPEASVLVGCNSDYTVEVSVPIVVVFVQVQSPIIVDDKRRTFQGLF